MKIRNYIVFIIITILSYTNVWGQQSYIFEQENGVYVLYYGERPFDSDKFKIYDGNTNNYINVENIILSSCKFEIFRDNSGTDKAYEFSATENNPINLEVGTYYGFFEYGDEGVIGDQYGNNKEIKIIPRPVTLSFSEPFSAFYDKSTEFNIADYADNNGNTFDGYFKNKVTIGGKGLAPVDNKAEVDYQNMKVVFGDAKAENDKSISVDWSFVVDDTHSADYWNNNYEISSDPNLKGNILPKTLTPTVEITPKKYDGTTNLDNSNVTINCDGIKNGDDVAIVPSGSISYPNANVGTYYINIPLSLSGNDKENYVLDENAGKNTEAKIIAADCPADKIKWNKNGTTSTLTYGQSVGNDLYVYADGFADASISYSYCLSSEDDENAIPYSVGSLLDNVSGSNLSATYKFFAEIDLGTNYNKCTSSKNVTVNQAELSFRSDLITKYWDGTNSLTWVLGENPNKDVDITITGWKNNDNIDPNTSNEYKLYSATCKFGKNEIGTYTGNPDFDLPTITLENFLFSSEDNPTSGVAIANLEKHYKFNFYDIKGRIVKSSCESSWYKNNTKVSSEVNITYRDLIGKDAVLEARANNNYNDPIYSFSKSFSTSAFGTESSSIEKLNVGEYTLRAQMSPKDAEHYDVCVATINLNVVAKEIYADFPYEKEKVYDGTKSVVVNEDEVNFYSDAEHKNDITESVKEEGVIIVSSLTYSESNAGNRPITLSATLQGDGAVNYKLLGWDGSNKDNDGRITKLVPSVEWRQVKVSDNEIVEGSTELKYSNIIGNSSNATLFANVSTDFSGYFLNSTAKYYVKNKGQADNNYKTIENPLVPGDYTVKVVFEPDDRNNIENAEGVINVTIKKEPINIQFEQTSESYGASVGALSNFELIFKCTNSLSDANLQYTFFIKDDDNSDFVEIPEGYMPNAGAHQLKCVCVDKNGFMEDGEKIVDINITQVVVSTIADPIFTLVKEYDGEYYAILESPCRATLNNKSVDLKTVGYYVKSPADVSADWVPTEADRVSNAGDYDIYYSVVLDEVSAKNFKLPDGYACKYYKNGTIKCKEPGIVLEDNFGENIIYGSSILGVSDRLKMYTYLDDPENIVFIEGEWSMSNAGLHENYPAGQMLNVGNYNLAPEFISENGNYCNALWSNGNTKIFKVSPKPLIVSSDLKIDNKYADGTDAIYESRITLPEFEGVIEEDLSRVKFEYDYSATKYPSAAIGDYDNIPLTVTIKGSSNYVFEASNDKTVTLKTSSSILRFNFDYNIEPDNSDVYQLVYGTSVLGRDLVVTNALDENQRIVYRVNDINSTLSMLRPGTYTNVEVQLREQDGNIDRLICSDLIEIYVDKLKLQVSDPEVSLGKVYDGNNLAKLIGSICTLTNVVEYNGIKDDVGLSSQTQVYDDPEIGANKKITISFVMSGNWASRYYEPDPVVFTNGVITPGVVEAGMVAATETGFCAGNDILVSVSVSKGFPSKYDIYFDDDVHAIGFTDIIHENFADYSDKHTIAFQCPGKSTHGDFSAKVKLFDEAGAESGVYPFKFSVLYESSIVESKFTDVVLINNKDGEFYRYQWYKSDVNGAGFFAPENMIEGAVEQFYNDLPYLKGWYGCIVSIGGSDNVKICPNYFDFSTSLSKSAERSVVVYPNPAFRMQPVTISLSNFAEHDYEKSIIMIYNSSGSIVATLRNIDQENTISLPSGNYSGVVLTDNKQKLTFKFIVRD